MVFYIPLPVIFSWPLPTTDPETRGHQLWIVATLFLFVATFFVGVRLWARIFIRRWIGLDDLLVFLAWVRESSPHVEDIRSTDELGVFCSRHGFRSSWDYKI
jgi:hypothetical protein